ncbi:hypothetical protein psyc5s11_50890 [Clostridium gelidum]|uniref:Methyltransferase FkbM domain-containing protein n=1 Tax=Clostridium gelidum TaxID=704125 RepID=A0ABM7TAN0_9CLOT|nr:hypothetical protein psyc5s11_50890 [Clostridium gelidum]
MSIKSMMKFKLKVLIGKEIELHPQKSCNKIRLGNDYGGWTIYPDNISNESIVYSFGIGEDISFDLEIIKKFNCKVFAFDPTPKSLKWLSNQQLPTNFTYYDYGISSFDGYTKFFMPKNNEYVSCSSIKNTSTSDQTIEVKVKKLDTIIKQLGHKKIDILKLDIEGSEYDVVEGILDSGIHIQQILIEFHHRLCKNGLDKTKRIYQKLNESGYKLFNVSESKEEYSFIHDKC